MKIGVLTYHRANNYGAFLQAYGLCSRLNEEKDIDAEVIDFHMQKEVNHYKPVRSIKSAVAHFPDVLHRKALNKTFAKGLKELKRSASYCLSDSVNDFADFVKGKYDIIIAGSDEIWKVNSIRSFPNPYWLIGDLGCKKFSYAASSRSVFNEFSEDVQNKIKDYLNDFTYISVRDSITLTEVKKVVNNDIEVKVYPDPSLIYRYNFDKKAGRELLTKRASLDNKQKIALVMTEDKSLARLIRKECGDKFQLVSVFERHNGYKNLTDLTPFEWMNAIAGADFVFTSYFHAVCFSLVNNQNFLAFGTPLKISKLQEVLSACDNMDRLIKIDEKLFKENYLKELVNKCSNAPDNTEFIEACRKSFDDYLAALRNSVK